MEALLLALIFLGVLWWWRRQRNRPLGRAGKTRNLGGTSPSRLLRELDRLTRDRRVSERLIERIEFNNPGRSRRWCIEKAIYDIQRDRRS